jgi:hypothetical protein
VPKHLHFEKMVREPQINATDLIQACDQCRVQIDANAGKIVLELRQLASADVASWRKHSIVCRFT